MKHTFRRGMSTWNKSNIFCSVLLTDSNDRVSVLSVRESKYGERYMTRNRVGHICYAEWQDNRCAICSKLIEKEVKV